MRSPGTQVRDLAIRDVVSVSPGATLRECAQAMRAGHVGCVVLVDEGSGRPVGVVTDRDIVVEAIAVGLDCATMTAGDIAARPVVSVREEDDAVEAMARMRECGVRRLPVTGAHGKLVGVLALDDLIGLVAELADSVIRVIAAEKTKEAQSRR